MNDGKAEALIHFPFLITIDPSLEAHLVKELIENAGYNVIQFKLGSKIHSDDKIHFITIEIEAKDELSLQSLYLILKNYPKIQDVL